MITRLTTYPGICLVLMLLLFAVSLVPASADTSVLRNGSFSYGMTDWVVNTSEGEWNPLTPDLAAKIYPPQDGFKGTVIHQNLNVTGVSGKQFLLYLWLRKVRAWSGNTVAIYLDYIDNGGTTHRMKILNPDNDSIAYQDWTLCTNNITLPSNAVRIVKFSLAKEDHGDLDIDGVMLLASGVASVGPVPTIAGISSDRGSYGSVLTIDGTNFGASPTANDRVLIGGSSDGITVQSWSSGRITVKVDRPAKGGHISVIANGVESEGGFSYTVTSPHPAIDVLGTGRKVIRGETARFVVRTDFESGYRPGGGITFSVPGAPAGSVAFESVPLHNPGGVKMNISTDGLAPGIHKWQVRAHDGDVIVGTAEFSVKVVTIGAVEFYTLGADGNRTQVSSLHLNKQQRIYLHCTVTGSDGEELPESVPMVLTSGSPYLQVIPMRWGGHQLYIMANISSGLTASFPDGFSRTIPVTSSLVTTPRIQSMSLSPVQVTNVGDQTISFSANATEIVDGFCDYNIGPLVDYSQSWTNGGLTFRCSGRVPEGLLPGDYLFHSWIRSDMETERARPVTVVNDPGRGMLKGSIYHLASGWRPDVQGILEFYNTSGSKVFEHRIYASGDYTVPYLQPGTYRVRFTPDGGFLPQWYPNAYSFSSAEPVVVSAGGTRDGVSFYLLQSSSDLPFVVSTDPENGGETTSDGKISVVFSKPMDVSTVTTGTFRLADGNGTPVVGTVKCDGYTAVFEPSSALTPGVTYAAKVTTGVRDTGGRAMASDYDWSFSVTADGSLSDLALLPDGASVAVSGKVLYLVRGSFGYIEETDRSSGMRIEGPISINASRTVSLSGTMRTSAGGERYIEINSMSDSGPGSVRPLGAAVTSLKGGLMSGLRVTAWGRVVTGSVTSNSFMINDGSDSDGLLIRTDSQPAVSDGEYVTITGAAGFDNGRVIYSE